MPALLTFSEAVRRAGVSRQRLNRAIHLGHLPAERGGGPGKPTRILLEDLQAWCASERLAVPVAPEHAEQAPAIVGQLDPTALMERLERTVEQAIARAVEQVVDQVVERLTAHLEHVRRLELLEHAEREERPRHTERQQRAEHPRRSQKAEVLHRILALKAEGFSLQHIADRLNADGVPTLSGRGSWKKGTVGNLLKGK